MVNKHEISEPSEQAKTGKGRYMMEEWHGIRKGRIAPSETQIMELITKEEIELFTKDEVAERIRHFFSDYLVIVDDENGGQHTEWKRPPTKTMLAAHLDMDVQTLSNYVDGRMSNGEYYTHTHRQDVKRKLDDDSIGLVRKAVAIITDYHESRLGANENVSGSIFWLNNLHNGSIWSNEQAISVKSASVEPKTVALVPRSELMREMYSDNETDIPVLTVFEEDNND